MPQVPANASTLPTTTLGVAVRLANAQTGNGATTDFADRGPSPKVNSTKISIHTVVGATPTCTYQIEVSANGSSWFNATYADVSTPNSDSSASFVITTAGLVEKIVKGSNWRYVRVTASLNTNVTNTVDIIFNDGKRFV